MTLHSTKSKSEVIDKEADLATKKKKSKSEVEDKKSVSEVVSKKSNLIE